MIWFLLWCWSGLLLFPLCCQVVGNSWIPEEEIKMTELRLFGVIAVLGPLLLIGVLIGKWVKKLGDRIREQRDRGKARRV